MEKKKEQPKKEKKSEQELAQDFFEWYQSGCEKHGFKIIVQPTLVARDDGTWSIRLVSSAERLAKKV